MVISVNWYYQVGIELHIHSYHLFHHSNVLLIFFFLCVVLIVKCVLQIIYLCFKNLKIYVLEGIGEREKYFFLFNVFAIVIIASY